MNLFILDQDPIIAAQYNCDKHVVKIILEAAQLLCTTSHVFNILAPYRKTHINHPVAIWVRKSKPNYDWAVKHALALCSEYTKRYGKIHKSEAIIKYCVEYGGKPTDGEFTPFAQAMPETYQSNDAVKSYREYYIRDKVKIATWKVPATIPDWFKVK